MEICLIIQSKMNTQKFRISCLVLILVFLALVVTEGILRKSHQKLFIPSCSNFLAFNPAMIHRYSLNSENLKSAIISKHKDKNAFRIFVIGTDSNSIIPINPNATFTHILTNALQKTLSPKNIEVINLSTSSPNSEVQCSLAEQVKKYEADVVIICPGYNEREDVKAFSNLRVVQKVKKILGVGKSEKANSHNKAESLSIFERNLDKMVCTLQQEKVPVFLVNTVNNFDAPPQETSFTSPDTLLLQSLFESGKKAFLQNDFETANSCFSAIYKKNKFHAATNFYMGKIALESNNLAEAHNMLTQAMKLDRSGNKIPKEVNHIILKVSTLRNCTLINAEQAFSINSKHGFPGNELFLGTREYNLAGNIILAKECYQAIMKKHFAQIDSHFEHSLTLFDKLYDKLASEKNFPEFTSVLYSTHVTDSFAGKTAAAFAENKISWEESMNALYDNYIRSKNYTMALKVIENLALENPYNVSINNNASKTAALLGDSQLVVHYAQKVYKMKPDYEVAQRLFINYLKLDQPEKALPYIIYAQNRRNDLIFIHQATCKVINLKKLLQKHPENSSLKIEIAQLYKSIGNEEVASSYQLKRE